MITTNDAPGYRVDEVFGEVFGMTVRSRHVGSHMGAAFKSLAGGELKGMTKNLEESRQEALSRHGLPPDAAVSRPGWWQPSNDTTKSPRWWQRPWRWRGSNQTSG